MSAATIASPPAVKRVGIAPERSGSPVRILIEFDEPRRGSKEAIAQLRAIVPPAFVERIDVLGWPSSWSVDATYAPELLDWLEGKLLPSPVLARLVALATAERRRRER